MTEMTDSQPADRVAVAAQSKDLAQQVHSWAVHFNGCGGNAAQDFIYSIEKLAANYDYELDELLTVLPLLLRGRALKWLRNFDANWQRWSDFRADFEEFFLKVRSLASIYERQLQPSESFKDYALDLRQLMQRAGFSEQRQVEQFEANCLRGGHNSKAHDYGIFLCQSKFQTVKQLIAGVAVFELQLEERKAQFVSSPTKACRSCGQQGHFSKKCRQQQLIFCWKCGRKGLPTSECCAKVAQLTP